MTPQEKAKELIQKFQQQVSRNGHRKENVRQCALIAVDELIHNTQPADKDHLEFWKSKGFTGYRQYWQQVKEEIEATP